MRRDGGAGDYAHAGHQQGASAPADGRYVDPRHAGMPPQQGAYGSHGAASVGPRSGEYDVSVRLEEIEILKNRLENLEQQYTKLQNDNARLEVRPTRQHKPKRHAECPARCPETRTRARALSPHPIPQHESSQS